MKVPAETFRIITVQDLAKLHHNLDDMANIRPPDLMLEGFEWRARPLDKVFDADTRGAEALHPRGSDGAVCQGTLCARAKVRVRQGNLHGGEFEGLAQRPEFATPGPAFLGNRPGRSPTECIQIARLPCRARRIPSGQAVLPKAQLGDALQYNPATMAARQLARGPCSALAGVQGLVASEGRVELDEMALELGRRQSP